MGSMGRSWGYVFVNLTAGGCLGQLSWASCSAVIAKRQFWYEKVKKASGNDETLHAWYPKEEGTGGETQSESWPSSASD